MWPWLILAGAAYWYYEKKVKKPVSLPAPSAPQSVEKRTPKMRVFDDAPSAPQDAPPDGGSSDGGGSAYVSSTPSPTSAAPAPAAAPTPAPVIMPLGGVKPLADFAKTVTTESVTFAPKPTAPASTPASSPAPIGPGPISSSNIINNTTPTPAQPSSKLFDLRSVKKTF